PSVLRQLSSQQVPTPFLSFTLHPPPTSTLFPYTTLFRSQNPVSAGRRPRADCFELGGGGGRREEREDTAAEFFRLEAQGGGVQGDRKSTRLNSSHLGISYAVFCLKKKKYQKMHTFQLSCC